MASLIPNAKTQFLDQNGRPLVGGKVYFYFVGTENKKDTFQDPALTIPNPNPVVLDSYGEASIWGVGAFRQVLTDKNGVQIWDQVTQESGEAVAGDFFEDTFVANGAPPFSFIPGTTTTLTLSRNYGSIGNIDVHFDASYQGPDQIASLSGQTLTFTAPIPLGVSNVYVKGGLTIPISKPASGSVTDDSVAAGSKLSNRIIFEFNVADYGLPTDGTSDSTPAARAAINAAMAVSGIGKAKVVFPAGVFRFLAASPTLDPGNGNIEFVGAGRDSTILIHEEGNATDASAFETRKHLFSHLSDTTMKGSVGFRDLQVKGTFAEGGYVERGGVSIALNYYRSIYIMNCRFTNKSQMNTACEHIGIVQVMNNEFDECMRDNVRFRSSWNCLVIGNTFKHSDDDAVALHQAVYVTGTGNIREGIIVADNTLEDTCGIHILGGRVVNVHDNILRRVKQTVINIDADANEGPNPIFAIKVHHNQIFDSLARAPFSAPQFCAISVTQFAPAGDTTIANTIPMQNVTSGGNAGLVTQFWPYRDENNASSGTFGWPTSVGIDISHNTIMRTLPAVAKYSDWGVGQCFSVGGYSDAPVTDAALRLSAGIAVPADARNLIVAGNTIMHTGSAISYYAPTTTFAGRNHKVYGNICYDFSFTGVLVNSPGSLLNFAADIYDNDFDGDPFHISSNRAPAGAWVADGAGPMGFFGNGITGVTFRENRIKNVSNPIVASNGVSFFIRDNHIVCSPAVTGFNAANKGIGNIPAAGPQYWHEIANCDPTSPGYNQQFNPTLLESTSIPTTGTYVAGHFVRNTAAGATVFGWQRLTTGSAHVAGTDWKAVNLS